MKTGIDIKQFKKWISKEVGSRCPDYNWDCFGCRTWKIYDELKGFIGFLDILDKMECDKKKVRPHKNNMEPKKKMKKINKKHVINKLVKAITKFEGIFYSSLENQLKDIFEGKSDDYNSDMTIQSFINAWASAPSAKDLCFNSSDIENYAKDIADEFGVEVDVKLNELR